MLFLIFDAGISLFSSINFTFTCEAFFSVVDDVKNLSVIVKSTINLLFVLSISVFAYLYVNSGFIKSTFCSVSNE